MIVFLHYIRLVRVKSEYQKIQEHEGEVEAAIFRTIGGLFHCNLWTFLSMIDTCYTQISIISRYSSDFSVVIC